MIEREHALLSASSAEKWRNCTPSARMEDDIPDSSGESAAEGTLAHELAEIKTKLYFKQITKTEYNKALKGIKANKLYAKDMDTHTDEYLEYIKDVEAILSGKPYVVIETTVDYSNYAPEGFGTVDCMMICGNELHVIDFKYGKMVKVAAINNPQLKLYALGALNRYGMLYSIEKIAVHIMQPRIRNLSSWECTVNELLKWAENTVKPQADKAFKGEGECVVGEWCDSHFCRARPKCRAYISRMEAIKPYAARDHRLLTNAEIGQALTLAKDIKKWYSVLENYAQSAILSGEDIEGWKVVEGRSNRAFDSIDDAFSQAIKAGVNEQMLYKRQPLTLTECEKMLGKKEFVDIFGSHIIKPPGKPTIVQKDDPREPFNPAARDFIELEGK